MSKVRLVAAVGLGLTLLPFSLAPAIAATTDRASNTVAPGARTSDRLDVTREGVPLPSYAQTPRVMPERTGRSACS